ncbi:hypothetical protein Tco_0511540 [Tanacetum coccineum]
MDNPILTLLKGMVNVKRVQDSAIVDKKKVIITETSIRRDLQLADENGTECLPNATIFAELERMGEKTFLWDQGLTSISNYVGSSSEAYHDEAANERMYLTFPYDPLLSGQGKLGKEDKSRTTSRTFRKVKDGWGGNDDILCVVIKAVLDEREVEVEKGISAHGMIRCRILKFCNVKVLGILVAFASVLVLCLSSARNLSKMFIEGNSIVAFCDGSVYTTHQCLIEKTLNLGIQSYVLYVWERTDGAVQQGFQLRARVYQNYITHSSTHVTAARALMEQCEDDLEGSELINGLVKQQDDHARMQRTLMFVTTLISEWEFLQLTNDPLALVSNASVQQYLTQSSKSPQSSNEPSPADKFQLDSGSSSTENLNESLFSNSYSSPHSIVLKSHLASKQKQYNFERSLMLANQEQEKNGPEMVVAGKCRMSKQRKAFSNLVKLNPLRAYNCNGLGHITPRHVQVPKATSDLDYFRTKYALMQAQEGMVVGLDGRNNVDCLLQVNSVSKLCDNVDDSTENDLALNVDYKYPLYLTRAKQAQSALYNGHVLVTTNHTPTIVHDSEDTREIAEITRKRMMEKMKSPLCVENKVRIAPPDYSKENLLATFAPQRNLTPEQIFWSIDNNDRKKAETSVPKPLSALTVYPPNTPVKLVPRVLPTKSQVKINLYVLTQLFTEFDKTCKKRITPTGVTEGERGFEQTKRCYLTEVIPFFKTLKEHFAGVQTALFKEVKVMEEIFDQMNDEVDQNTVDKQCAEIERKNLLIANENLIANCLSNQLLYDVEKSRCLDLETEMSKVQNEIKHVSKLEREYLNLQLKYQHLQESFDNNKSQTSQDVPEFNSFFKINNLENQIQEKDNVIRDLKVLVSNVNDRNCEPYNANDVTDLLEQNERLRAEIEKVKQHYKEMFESIKITRTSTNEQTSSLLTQIEDLKAQLEGNLKVATRSSVKTKVLAPGMYAIDVEPIPPRLKNNRNAHLTYINHLKESVETVREIVEEARVVKPLDNNSPERDSKAPSIPLTRKKPQQVTFTDTCSTSTNNTQKHGVHQKTQPSNVQVIPSTGVSSSTRASGSKPRSNTKHNRILPAKSVNNKKVEDHPRTTKVWDVSLAEPNQVSQPPDHLRKWTKDHPLDNIIGNPSRTVSTRKQLASDALWCCFHTELSKVEPKRRWAPPKSPDLFKMPYKKTAVSEPKAKRNFTIGRLEV